MMLPDRQYDTQALVWLLEYLSKVAPQNITKATAGSSAADAARLVANGSYLVTVQPSAADLDTTTGVYWSLYSPDDEVASPATANSPMWLSSWGPLPLVMSAEQSLSLLRIGSADVTVQVMGATAASTTAIPA